jgi:hypothetical protein
MEFARTLVGSQIHGVPGKELLNFAGTISPNELDCSRLSSVAARFCHL